MATENEVRGVLERFIGDVRLKVAGLEVHVNYGLTSDHVHGIDFMKDGIWVVVDYSIPRDSWGVTLLRHPECEMDLGYGEGPDEAFRLDHRVDALKRVVDLLLNRA